MKKEIPPALVGAAIVLILLIVGTIMYNRLAGGPMIMDASKGPPADLLKNAPPPIHGGSAPTSLNPGQSRPNQGNTNMPAGAPPGAPAGMAPGG